MRFATLCFLQRDDKTLMLHRNKNPDDMHYGKYVPLGGKIEHEKGESPDECVIREVFEESGLKIKSPKLKGILTFDNTGRTFSGKKQDNWYVIVYTATDFDCVMQSPHEGDLVWINNSDLLNLPLWEGDKVFIPWINKPGVFSAKFQYNEDKMTKFDVNFS
jgi:8-oxo-dGTP diphosphatase